MSFMLPVLSALGKGAMTAGKYAGVVPGSSDPSQDPSKKPYGPVTTGLLGALSGMGGGLIGGAANALLQRRNGRGGGDADPSGGPSPQDVLGMFAPRGLPLNTQQAPPPLTTMPAPQRQRLGVLGDAVDGSGPTYS